MLARAYSVLEVVEKVKRVRNKLGFDTEIEHVENPRFEKEDVSYYNPVHEKLYKLGFKPEHTLEEELNVMLTDLKRYKSRIVEKKDKILPRVQWKAE